MVRQTLSAGKRRDTSEGVGVGAPEILSSHSGIASGDLSGRVTLRGRGSIKGHQGYNRDPTKRRTNAHLKY